MKIRGRVVKVRWRWQWRWSNPKGHPFTFIGPIVVEYRGKTSR